MPSPTRTITTRDIRRYVDEHVFAPNGAQRVGIELEWITSGPARDALPSLDELRTRLGGALVGASRLTFEPGGQLELSGPAHADAAGATEAMATDVAAARAVLASLGVDLVGIGLDPTGLRDRVLDEPRYVAMESYFDTHWPMGRTMMRNTAAVQVNLDLGDFGAVDQRWQRAHDLAPVLGAAFANSPFDASGAPSGWRSTRLAVWRGLDVRRTRAAVRPGTSAPTAWTSYALEAPVMFVRAGERHCTVPARPLPFARWIHEGHELGWPTLDDFAYHLTTLFPPVRPRGWLELRTVDALPDAWWPVAVAVSAALLDDPEAADAAAREAPAMRHRVADAARLGCSDPAIGAVVDRCFAAALPAVARMGADAPTVAAAEDYYERYVARRRCPADDLFPFADPARLPARDLIDPMTAATTRIESLRDGPAHSLADALSTARARSLAILEPVDAADQERQVSDLMSPLCWDLAHIGHYEELWLVRTLTSAPPADGRFDDVYDAFKHPRRERGTLDILDAVGARRFVASVRERALEVLAHIPADDLAPGTADPLLAGGFVHGMVVQHEHQHDETMLATLQLMDGFPHPEADRAADTGRAAPRASTPLPIDVLVDGGTFTMGTDTDRWAYDNERPAHAVTLAPYRIDTTAVTNRAYLEFVRAGGYDDERLWTPAGWAWRRETGSAAPGAWSPDGGGGWVRTRFGRTEPVPLDEPVQHVCWYEADAFARWAGARLPTEAEWERAALGTELHASNLWPADGTPHRWAPAPVGTISTASTVGAVGMFGDVWEWTATDFTGHPGFVSFPYREYSEVFFGSDHKVLRGGSWATHPSAIRTTFRNWDYPIRRQIFSGFRCARDA